MISVTLFLVTLFIAPQDWVPGLLGWPVDYFVYLFWISALAVRGRLPEFMAFKAQDWFFLGMVCWIGLSCLVNEANASTREILLNYTKWFVLYRMTAATIESPDALRRAGWVIFGVASLIAVEALAQLWSADGIGWAGQGLAWVDESAKSIGVDRRTRWVGIFDGPGVFCVMFTVALPFALQYLSAHYPLSMRLFAGGVMVPLMALAIFSTGSRGGYLTAIAVIGLWVLSRVKLDFRKLLLAGVVVGIGVLLGPAYLTSTTDASSSAQHRVEMWAEGLEMVQQNPLFGIGKGNFAPYTGKLIAHNSGVEVMGETGMPGLFLWFAITFMGMKNLIRRHAESPDPRERELLIALGLSVIGYFVSSLFVTLEYPTLYFLLGLTAGVRTWTMAPVSCGKREIFTMGSIVVWYFVAIKLFAMSY